MQLELSGMNAGVVAYNTVHSDMLFSSCEEPCFHGSCGQQTYDSKTGKEPTGTHNHVNPLPWICSIDPPSFTALKSTPMPTREPTAFPAIVIPNRNGCSLVFHLV